MKLSLDSNEPKQALRANSASFQTIMNRNTATTDRHFDTGAGAINPHVWAFTLYEMVHNEKYAGISEDRKKSSNLVALVTSVVIVKTKRT